MISSRNLATELLMIYYPASGTLVLFLVTRFFFKTRGDLYQLELVKKSILKTVFRGSALSSAFLDGSSK